MPTNLIQFPSSSELIDLIDSRVTRSTPGMIAFCAPPDALAHVESLVTPCRSRSAVIRQAIWAGIHDVPHGQRNRSDVLRAALELGLPTLPQTTPADDQLDPLAWRVWQRARSARQGQP